MQILHKIFGWIFVATLVFIIFVGAGLVAQLVVEPSSKFPENTLKVLGISTIVLVSSSVLYLMIDED